MSQAAKEKVESEVLRVLTFDGGGAKGFYTLGVLKEVETMIGCPLHQKFDLVFGTSTGAEKGSAEKGSGKGVRSLFRDPDPSDQCTAGRFFGRPRLLYPTLTPSACSICSRKRSLPRGVPV